MYEKPRLFVDMDGTLAEWRNIKIVIERDEDANHDYVMQRLDDVLYSSRYYYRLRPQQNVVDAVKNIIRSGEIEVFVLSCVKPDARGESPLRDKNEWLDKYLPEIDNEHRIFVPDGENKRNYIPGGVRVTDALLDDYTKNLREFAGGNPPGITIKLYNHINSSHKTYAGSAVSCIMTPATISAGISTVVISEGREEIRHDEPDKDRTPISDRDYLAGLKALEDIDNE